MFMYKHTTSIYFKLYNTTKDNLQREIETKIKIKAESEKNFS